MRILIGIVCICLLLGGCKSNESNLGPVLNFRQRLLEARSYQYDATVTADYGDEIYTFALSCLVDSIGNLKFEVKVPESISGIAGTFDASGGKLIFDKQVLAFPVLADGEVSPVSAPWILNKTLEGGYIHSVAKEQNFHHAIIHESYEDNALQLHVWFDLSEKPVRAEILWGGRSILSIIIENFVIL